MLKTRYGLAGEPLKDFECLNEIRNEIVHTVPFPTETNDQWPEYPRRVKDKQVAVEYAEPGKHYTFFAQMASHDLFTSAIYVTRLATRPPFTRSLIVRGCSNSF